MPVAPASRQHRIRLDKAARWVTGGLLLSVAMGAQGAAIIDGKVTDSIGHPLPGVSVEMILESGGRMMHATTDASGTYHFEGLPAGTFRVDFSLPGFAGRRENHVRPGSAGRALVDAALSVRPLCECVSSGISTASAIVVGQVVDEAGRPLPHAHLEITTPQRRETAYADSEGRFRVHPPAEGSWPIVASDSGFAPDTRQISNATTAPLVFRLRFIGTQGVPDIEAFNHQCACPEFFVLEDR